ncbi:MAG: hypothetical protein ACI8TQ_002012 [Planctomycetota bacterium]|jgi:hypothetical protein
MKVVQSAHLRGLSSPARLISLCALCVIALGAIVVIEPSDSVDVDLKNRQLRARLGELISNVDDLNATEAEGSESHSVMAKALVEQFRSTKYDSIQLNGMLRWLTGINEVALRHLQVSDSPSSVSITTETRIGLREVTLRGTGSTSSVGNVLSDLNQLGFRHAVLSFDFTGLDESPQNAQFALVLGLFEAVEVPSDSTKLERHP